MGKEKQQAAAASSASSSADGGVASPILPSASNVSTLSSAPMMLSMLTLLALATRLAQLAEPHWIVFDEVHFGGFASRYIRGEYFFDVHPPLAKMLLGAVSYLAGNQGDFLYETLGHDYTTTRENYVALRAFCAVQGAALVPLMYVIVTSVLDRAVTRITAQRAGLFAASFVLFDTALVTQSRYILLDASLLLFTFLTVATLARFYVVSYQNPSGWFSTHWWLMLALTGIFMGCALSVKYIGLFLVALVGLYTIWDLWQLLGEPTTLVSDSQMGQHLAARALTLIVLPLVVYVALFAVHLHVLRHSGPGDVFHTPRFIAGLEGSSVANMTQAQPYHIRYGSRITLRPSYRTQKCYLHSHTARYPLHHKDFDATTNTTKERGSSTLQQCTCYEHNDVNNWWTVLPLSVNTSEPFNVSEPEHMFPKTGDYVRHGDLVRLQHTQTLGFLHTHNVGAPVTATQQEVAAMHERDGTAFPPQLVWRLDFLDGFYWHPLYTRVRLISTHNQPFVQAIVEEHPDRARFVSEHPVHLALTDKRMDESAFNQLEVSAARSDTTGGGTADVWHVEEHLKHVGEDDGDAADQVCRGKPTMGFWERFMESHVEMLSANNRLTATHSYQSVPSDWPLLRRGVAYWQSKDANRQVYFLGNPLIWGLGTIGLFFAPGCLGVALLAVRRGRLVLSDELSRTLISIGLPFAGYLLHYLPFFLMERQLFLHHYLPALLFQIALLSVLLAHLSALLRLSGSSHEAVLFASLALAAALVFAVFAPLVYGLDLTPHQIRWRQWRASWDLRVLAL